MSAFPKVPRLPYDEIRPQIRSGDILLCSGSAVFSRLIQHATESIWSHCGFVLRIEAIERLMVLQSVESIGVNTVPMSNYVRNYNGTDLGYPGRVFVARHAAFATVDPAQLSHFSQGAVDLLGYPYDVPTILAIAARITAAKLGMRPEPFVRNKAFICSEYLDACLRSIGIEVPYDPRGFIAPCDFAKCTDVTILWEIAIESPS